MPCNLWSFFFFFSILGYNNYGDEQGGKNRLKIGLDIESPLGVNDLLSMNIQGVKRKQNKNKKPLSIQCPRNSAGHFSKMSKSLYRSVNFFL